MNVCYNFIDGKEEFVIMINKDRHVNGYDAARYIIYAILEKNFFMM